MDAQSAPIPDMDPHTASESHPSGTLPKIIKSSNLKDIIPIISNSFYIDEILRREHKITMPNQEEVVGVDQELTVEKQLTRIWAHRHEHPYPMADDFDLARVSQYYQVISGSSTVAKDDYLEFLKSYLLEINAKEKKDTVKRLQAGIDDLRFSEILKQLGYLKLPYYEDPMQILAKVPFPVYITTSYHDFLERALIDAGRPPKSQLIFWEDGMEDDLENTDRLRQDPLIKPTGAEPVVYHLFGLEHHPKTLVISEDDYMKFLVSVLSAKETDHPVVPLKLKERVATAQLLLLGYQLSDWDFRVLFRFIMEMRKGKSLETLKTGICIQIPPKNKTESLIDYLRDYFKPKLFDVEWKRPMSFTREIGELWERQLPHD